MSAENESVVRNFCRDWSTKNFDKLLAYFTDDAVYHNIPMDPIVGKAAIREVFNAFAGSAEHIQWDILNAAASGNVVFTERVDRFTIAGKPIALPVAGVFEIRNGKIAAWRDYFDMQMWLKQQA